MPLLMSETYFCRRTFCRSDFGKCENKNAPPGAFLFAVAGGGFAPPTSWLCLPLRFSSLRRFGKFVVWTIPSSQKDVCHLVSTPSLICRVWLGITIFRLPRI